MDDFKCRCCGHCCRIEGVVSLKNGEVETMAALLGMTVEVFTAQFTRLSYDRKGLELIEQDDHSCIFLEPDNSCRVQDAKPKQCRDYPHKWQREEIEVNCAARKMAEN